MKLDRIIKIVCILLACVLTIATGVNEYANRHFTDKYTLTKESEEMMHSVLKAGISSDTREKILDYLDRNDSEGLEEYLASILAEECE